MIAKRDIIIHFCIKEMNYKSTLHFRKMANGNWIYVLCPSFDLTYDEVIEAIKNCVGKLMEEDEIRIEFDGNEVTKEFLK